MRLRRFTTTFTFVGPLLVFALAALAGPEAAGYRRQDWPHWDRTESGCDVRRDVIARDASHVSQDPDRACAFVVLALRDPYGGEEIREPARVDVDHVVPLKWAHEHGGAAWDRERRRAYANDVTYRHHLRAVSARLNRQKGARGPAEWVPPDRAAHCDYGHWWSAILVRWDLRPGPADRAAIGALLEACRTSAAAWGG